MTRTPDIKIVDPAAFMKVIDYIHDSELNNFLEGPSDDHVMYQLLAALHGKNHADAVLSMAVAQANGD